MHSKKRSILRITIGGLLFSGCALFSIRPVYSNPSPDDRLTPAEEDYAYDTKNPSQRVRAFLKIADSRVDTLRKTTRRNASTDSKVTFSGYSTALEGAWMAISWGKAMGLDMQRSIQAITKTTRKHLRILHEIEARLTPQQTAVLSQFRLALLRSQNLDQSASNIAKSDPSPLDSYEDPLTTDSSLQ